MEHRSTWMMFLLKGGVLTLLGILILFNPVGTVKAIAFYIGLILLITGIALIINNFITRKEISNWIWGFGEGVMDIVFGLALIINPGTAAGVFVLILGIWIIIYGILKLVEAFRLKKYGIENWWMTLVVAVFNIFIGYMIASNLTIGAFAMTVWLGLGLLIFGVVNLYLGWKLKMAV